MVKSQGQRAELMKVALGEAEADLAIVNGSIVNVYTGEVLERLSVLIKGDKIAYVSNDVRRAVSSSTKVIDAAGKTLIPGLIDGHTHIDGSYSISEILRFAIKGGTPLLLPRPPILLLCWGMRGLFNF